MQKPVPTLARVRVVAHTVGLLVVVRANAILSTATFARVRIATYMTATLPLIVALIQAIIRDLRDAGVLHVVPVVAILSITYAAIVCVPTITSVPVFMASTSTPLVEVRTVETQGCESPQQCCGYREVQWIGMILSTSPTATVVGGLLGWLGRLLSLSAWPWRPALITIVALFALWQSLSRRPATLGLHRQVPRKWARIMRPEPCYFLWGALLGCGIATVIPYSAFLVVLATQLTSGVVLGCISGMLFGATRELVALLPLLGKQNRVHPLKLVLLLPALAEKVQWLNTLWLLVGSPFLVIAGWR